jgi:hypothetical protein
MRESILYVEGRGEVHFISQFIEYHFNDFEFSFGKERKNSRANCNELKLKIQSLEGISAKRMQSLVKEIRSNEALGIECALIIDADTEEHKKPAGGCENRLNYCQKLKEDHRLNFKYFIIPNGKDDGNLETLLEGAISDRGKPFFNCLNSFRSCANKVEIRSKEINVKEIFEWYEFMVHGNGKETKQTSRVYHPSELWDLNRSDLYPLKNFLENSILT